MEDVTNSQYGHIVQVIDKLYNSSDPNEQTEANRQLTELQSSNEAWQICWPLLDPSQPHSEEVHFFAANLLVLKINQSWGQQDPAWLENQLRPKLFETLVKYAGSPQGTKLVIERLALALANFALHSIPTFWPDAIEDILQTFTSSNLPVTIPHQRICDILLRILIYIPEEYSVMLPHQDHRAKLNGQMTKSGPIVFKFLHSLLLSNPSNTTIECKQNLLKCLTSWTLHSQTSLLELEDGRSLLDSIYELITNDDLCSSACSTLAASFSSQKADSFRNAIIDFIPKIANLKDVIDKYKGEDEMENAIKIYSLVINFSENHTRLFLKIVLSDGIQMDEEKTNLTMRSIFTIIKIILDCTAAPGIFGLDEKYSEMAFPFWFTFFENFYYYSESYNDVICDTFDPLVDSLLQTLIIKSRYPPSITYHQQWNDDQREAYRCYRQDLGDNISLIVQFPRARERILSQFEKQLNQELALMTQSQGGDEIRWQELESTIFAIKSISETIPFDEAEYMPRIFDLLSRIPFNESQPELYCTAAEMISSCSDWLFSHSEHLGTAFTILFLGVSSANPSVRLMSTLSLKDLTSECQTLLQPYASQIVSSCTNAILQHSNILTTSEKSRLMNTIGTTLAVTPVENVTTSLTALTTPIIYDLGVRAQDEPTADPTSRLIILDRLTMLNSLIESLYVKPYSGNEYEDADENDIGSLDISRYYNISGTEVPQPIIGLLKQLVPILMIISERYRSDEQIMEKISNTVKRSAKSLGIDMKPVLEDLLTIIVNAYDPLTNSSILEGSVPLFMVFKVDKTLRDFFRDAFARIADKTLKVCLENPLGQLSVTVENYFRFATCIFKKYPTFMAEYHPSINVEYIYKLALASLELPEKRTLGEVCSFLCLFRQKSIGVEHLHRIFVNHLDLLLNNIFSIFGGNFSTPRNAIEQVIDLLYLITNAEEAKDSLTRHIVERDNFPTTYVDREQKARFISRIVHEKNRRKYKDACSDFVLAVRNLSRLA